MYSIAGFILPFDLFPADMKLNPMLFGIALVGAFVAGSFIASAELRAYAAATIGSADIIDNSIQSADIKDGDVKVADIGNGQVTAAKIKDGEVKAAEIAADAVTASEINGVSKLIFVDCSITDNTSYNTNGGNARHCSAPGTANGDRAVVSNNGNLCFVMETIPVLDSVYVRYTNVCPSSSTFGTNSVAIIVFDT